jgi:inner membrane protease subunit SOM1
MNDEHDSCKLRCTARRTPITYLSFPLTCNSLKALNTYTQRQISPFKVTLTCQTHRTQPLNLNFRLQPFSQLPRSLTHTRTHPINLFLSLTSTHTNPSLLKEQTMSPPLPLHPLSALESQINLLPNGKARKPPVKLSECALKEMVQYKCNISISKDKTKTPVVVCQPFVRLLRQ